MMRLIGSAATVALVALASFAPAHAQTAASHTRYACPAVQDIVAKPGVTYSAPAANGQHWSGEDPMAPDTIQINAGNTRFKGGRVGASKTVVMCDYEHTLAGTATQIRLALDLKKHVATAGDQWKTTTHCEGQNPAHCAFD